MGKRPRSGDKASLKRDRRRVEYTLAVISSLRHVMRYPREDHPFASWHLKKVSGPPRQRSRGNLCQRPNMNNMKGPDPSTNLKGPDPSDTAL
jgi:hypothetical protein